MRFRSKHTRKSLPKKAMFGFSTVGDMILILVVLGILLYITYSLFWEKIIQGGLAPTINSTIQQSDHSRDSLNDILGEPARTGDTGATTS
ncbi:MAG: hypothetical protein GXP63_02630 [DPANN group archaeon]|nr:hypothetical protein [DPANN group archaeon]